MGHSLKQYYFSIFILKYGEICIMIRIKYRLKCIVIHIVSCIRNNIQPYILCILLQYCKSHTALHTCTIELLYRKSLQHPHLYHKSPLQHPNLYRKSPLHHPKLVPLISYSTPTCTVNLLQHPNLYR